MASEEEIRKNRWPEVEFTDKYPGFYIDKLENGTREDQERVCIKFMNQWANNHLMRALRSFEDGRGVEVINKFYKEVIEPEDITRLKNIGNLLIGLGHKEWEEHAKKNYSQSMMWDTRGHPAPEPETLAENQ